jgi:hypothetical protein
MLSDWQLSIVDNGDLVWTFLNKQEIEVVDRFKGNFNYTELLA